MFPINHKQKPTHACLEWAKKTLNVETINAQPLPEHAHHQKNLYTITLPQLSQTYLLIEAVNNSESSLKFIALAKQLRENNIHVPIVHFQQISKNRSWIITTHFGHETALDWLSKPHQTKHREQLLQHCLHEIHLFQKQKIDYPVTTYTASKRLQDMNLTDTFFLHKLLNTSEKDYHKADYAYIKQSINEYIESIPMTLMHFDFHSANLMLLPKRTLGVLDFQDLAIGPINYDLASLLTDHYYHHNELDIQNCIQQFYHQYLPLEQQKNLSLPAFKEATIMVAVQRHLKNIGIFSRLFFNQKPNYIKHIPNMMYRLKLLCQQHPTLQKLPDILWSSTMKTAYINGITQFCQKNNLQHSVDALLSTLHTQKPSHCKIND